MKFRNNILTAFALSTVITFTACSKDDGPIPERIGIEDVPAMTMNLEPQKKNNNDTIRIGNPGAFSTKFKVAMVFPDQLQPTKVDIVVRKNGSAANVKTYKADISSFPTSFTITAADIATLFGAPIALNDTYDFAPDIYVDSKKYQAFPLVGAGNGSGVVGMNAIGFYEYVRIMVKN
ncbi:MAG TPA: hypothetical protein VEB42_08905 [Chitinophagaceae bacterium]|nr:hypothetical protein [Chitinophagaceae bacterium]